MSKMFIDEKEMKKIKLATVSYVFELSPVKITDCVGDCAGSCRGVCEDSCQADCDSKGRSFT